MSVRRIGKPRVHEQVDGLVEISHVAMRYLPGEDDVLREPELLGQPTQQGVLRPATDQQDAGVRAPGYDAWERLEQQRQALPREERTNEAERIGVAEPVPGPRRLGGTGRGPRRPQGLGIDRVGHHGDAIGRHSARDDVPSQALADGGHGVRSAQRMGLEPSRGAVAEAAFGGRARTHRRVLPRRAQLVHQRHAERHRGERV
jgi:hypothetical protein